VKTETCPQGQKQFGIRKLHFEILWTCRQNLGLPRQYYRRAVIINLNKIQDKNRHCVCTRNKHKQWAILQSLNLQLYGCSSSITEPGTTNAWPQVVKNDRSWRQFWYRSVRWCALFISLSLMTSHRHACITPILCNVLATSTCPSIWRIGDRLHGDLFIGEWTNRMKYFRY